MSRISVLEVSVQSCQYIPAWMESGQRRLCHECQGISLTVVNVNTDSFSRGHFIFSGHRAQIRSDKHMRRGVHESPVRDVLLSAPLTGTKEKQTSSKSKVRNTSCRRLSPRRGSGGFTAKFSRCRGITHATSLITRECALENLTVTGHKRRSHVGSCVKGCNAC